MISNKRRAKFIINTSSRKKISINVSRTNTKFCLSLLYTGDDSYLYVNKTEIFKFKANDSTSWYNFYLESVSKDFTKDEQHDYDFSVDHSSTKKEDILNIHEYLMVKNNIK